MDYIYAANTRTGEILEIPNEATYAALDWADPDMDGFVRVPDLASAYAHLGVEA